MGLRKLRYLRIKQDLLDFAIHYHPGHAVGICDNDLMVDFEHTTLIISFYKDMDEGDGKIRMKTEIRPFRHYSEPFVFGRIYDSLVIDDDMKKATRDAIEMGKHFDIAYGYEQQLIGGLDV